MTDAMTDSLTGRRRVVVTGMGVISAAGNTLADFWDHLCAGRSGIAEVQRGGEQWGGGEAVAHLAAQVRLPGHYRLPPHISPESLDDFSVFALHAAEQALQQAGMAQLLARRQSIGVVLGSAVGGDEARNLATYRVYIKQRPPAPQTIIRAMANSAVGAVSLAYGLQGPSHAVSSACASGTHAIGQAYHLIASGLADVMLAGGSEQLPSYSLYRSWRQMRVLSPDGCRPFCADRNGMVLGEGAAVLVLESLASAQARGAPILGEICGFAMNASATDWTIPDSQTMARCMTQALGSAGWDAAQVGFINAHGTGTLLNDAAEAQAIHSVFGAHARDLPVSSSKAMHGHALGASGALECVAALLALREGKIPPNGDSHQADPGCPLNIIHGAPRAHGGAYALSNSFAFGGLNGVLALGRQDCHDHPHDLHGSHHEL
ncbi:beta-ACP synthase [Janthinobacterium sp. ROICE36]|uniref:beta-ketoacyl-[acyl-carrier-protein] synthase family protein n=1 Tax=Janthinobacterium sp. ROICE36 TaxID=2048670 RepID=UPI000C7F7165|nr:beta-ketoacyl-[acyl-carrier-protein] synthase family protein [Janthinobacterium sp. ROICE36]PLY42117.1 beta-ACP synthase [Janthinobacterium sp. ROICE36]